MKIRVKKKMYRLGIKLAARKGLMNDSNGNMVERRVIPDNSMKRDYRPQR